MNIKNTSRVLFVAGGWMRNTTTVCVATEPYTECSTKLIKVLTIIIYFVVVFFSIIFNPWVSF